MILLRSICEFIFYNKKYLGNTTHLYNVFSDINYNLQSISLKETNDNFLSYWRQKFLPGAKLIFEDKKPDFCVNTDWNEAYTTHNCDAFDLFVIYVAHVIKRHIVILHISEQQNINPPTFISGNMFNDSNVISNVPILLARINSGSGHYQSLCSKNSNFWQTFCMKKLRELGENIESSTHQEFVRQ